MREATDVIVLNGGSSSGTTALARHVQASLRPSWLVLGVDDLIEAMPQGADGDGSVISFEPGGRISLGPEFWRLQAAWLEGIAAIARSGTGVIVDDVFLGAAASQSTLRDALRGLRVVWVGVHCDAAVASAREATRPDRVPGMAASQAELVHRGVDYDVTVDTSSTPAADCARTVLEYLGTAT